ncbi:hypothetical protein EMCG_01638 [[Emmonsia] crescens]|uniref:Uncharacterized protein n=1 Tax=[Emmonsia] crescens TaxID=73230 RepID=A0A0G2J2F0_9EURO|nr:hypothetical protein EMCG_01638 [Emmonsia crescens UAMH 3008]
MNRIPLAAVYLANRTPTRTLDWKSPLLAFEESSKSKYFTPALIYEYTDVAPMQKYRMKSSIGTALGKQETLLEPFNEPARKSPSLSTTNRLLHLFSSNDTRGHPDTFAVGKLAMFMTNPSEHHSAEDISSSYLVELLTEAELVTISRAGKESIWWDRFFRHIQFEPGRKIRI